MSTSAKSPTPCTALAAATHSTISIRQIRIRKRAILHRISSALSSSTSPLLSLTLYILPVAMEKASLSLKLNRIASPPVALAQSSVEPRRDACVANLPHTFEIDNFRSADECRCTHCPFGGDGARNFALSLRFPYESHEWVPARAGGRHWLLRPLGRVSDPLPHLSALAERLYKRLVCVKFSSPCCFFFCLSLH